MKGMITVCLWTLVTLMVPSTLCNPGGYGDQSGYGGGAAGYASVAGGYGGGSYGGPKRSAADALKSSYNNQNGYNYNFGYDIQDSAYSNYQSRQESGSGDPKGETKGSYSVVEPDGSRRTVNYVADWVNGFRATVSDKNGLTQHGYNSGGYGGGNGAGHGGTSGGYGGSSGGFTGGYGGSTGSHLGSSSDSY